jgi:queuine/archaeosine tRNA-ribosyltransferase
MGEIRSAILDGTFSAFRDNFLASYQPTDEQTRVSQKQKWLERRNRGE